MKETLNILKNFLILISIRNTGKRTIFYLRVIEITNLHYGITQTTFVKLIKKIGFRTQEY